MIREEPCKDCISRQAAINAMIKIEQDDIDQYGCKILEGFDSRPAIEALEDLPSVTPQSEIGHRIIVDDCEKFIAKCSECGRIEDSRMKSKYSYCHCGAKMKE